MIGFLKTKLCKTLAISLTGVLPVHNSLEKAFGLCEKARIPTVRLIQDPNQWIIQIFCCRSVCVSEFHVRE